MSSGHRDVDHRVSVHSRSTLSLSSQYAQKEGKTMNATRWWRRAERVVTATALVAVMSGSWTLTPAQADRGVGIDPVAETRSVPSDPDQIRKDLSAVGMDITSPAVQQLVKNLTELGETYFE
jgi:hypothetical protein